MKVYGNQQNEENQSRRRFLGASIGAGLALLTGTSAFLYSNQSGNTPSPPQQTPHSFNHSQNPNPLPPAQPAPSPQSPQTKPQSLEQTITPPQPKETDQFKEASIGAIDQTEYIRKIFSRSKMPKTAIQGVYFNPSLDQVRELTEPLLAKKYQGEILKTITDNSVTFYDINSKLYPIVYLPGFDDIFLDKIPVNIFFPKTTFNTTYIHSDADLQNYLDLILLEQNYRHNGVQENDLTINSDSLAEGKFTKHFAKACVLMTARHDQLKNYLQLRAQNQTPDLSFEQLESVFDDYYRSASNISELNPKTPQEETYLNSLTNRLSNIRVSKCLIQRPTTAPEKFFSIKSNINNIQQSFDHIKQLYYTRKTASPSPGDF